ncbi:hypothetical protein GOODEAATRI_032163 [Goodea atripinnis]|uniref:Uncharacterized protein n=1 Tax=Goodea atripinnis TaxID=208336 RepID=A0ABV0PIX0_9TELE
MTSSCTKSGYEQLEQGQVCSGSRHETTGSYTTEAVNVSVRGEGVSSCRCAVVSAGFHSEGAALCSLTFPPLPQLIREQKNWVRGGDQPGRLAACCSTGRAFFFYLFLPRSPRPSSHSELYISASLLPGAGVSKLAHATTNEEIK